MEAVAAGTLLPGAWRVAEQVKPVQMGGVGVRRQEEEEEGLGDHSYGRSPGAAGCPERDSRRDLSTSGAVPVSAIGFPCFLFPNS